MISPDTDGWVHGYYGSYNINEKKPAYGVHLYMINEYVSKNIEKEKEKFIQQIEAIIKDFHKVNKQRLDKVSEEIKILHEVISDNGKIFEELVKLNGLKKPEIVKKQKKKNVKKQDEFQPIDMGYL